MYIIPSLLSVETSLEIIHVNYDSLKMENNNVTFEKKWLDRNIPMRFKINYWFLKKLSLEGFRILFILGGILITVIVHEFPLK